MKTILNRFNKEPSILHLPGGGLEKFKKYVDELRFKTFEQEPFVFFLTICTDNIDSPLLYQLKTNNIPHYNLIGLIEDIYDPNIKWNWMYKYIALQRFFDKYYDNFDPKTLFVLLDARDIYLNNIKGFYKKYQDLVGVKKILCCGSKSDYPNIIKPTNKSNKSKYPVYINAGGIIGRKEYLRTLTNIVLECNKSGYCEDYKLNEDLINDDQYLLKIIRYYLPNEIKYNQIKVDEDCDFFQTICLSEIRIENNLYII